MHRNTFVLASAIACALLSSAAGAENLLEVYQDAVQNDPLIREAEARREAALEVKPQARGLLLPQVNIDGQWAQSDSDSNSTFTQAVDQDNDPNTPPGHRHRQQPAGDRPGLLELPGRGDPDALPLGSVAAAEARGRRRSPWPRPTIAPRSRTCCCGYRRPISTCWPPRTRCRRPRRPCRRSPASSSRPRSASRWG